MNAAGQALLRNICQHTHDLDARLVYADWLDDNGDPDRAAFIRCQIELFKLKADALPAPHVCLRPFRVGVNMSSVVGVTKGTPYAACGQCEICTMRSSTQDLWEANHYHWGETPGISAGYSAWRCGFVDKVSISFRQWYNYGPAAVCLQPIRSLTLESFEDVPHEMAGALNRVVSLRYTETRFNGRQLVVIRMEDAYRKLPEISDAMIQWARGEAGLD